MHLQNFRLMYLHKCEHIIIFFCFELLHLPIHYDIKSAKSLNTYIYNALQKSVNISEKDFCL